MSEETGITRFTDPPTEIEVTRFIDPYSDFGFKHLVGKAAN